MQTTNLLLLGVGALSVAAQASLPRVAESIARLFGRRLHDSHDHHAHAAASQDCHG